MTALLLLSSGCGRVGFDTQTQPDAGPGDGDMGGDGDGDGANMVGDGSWNDSSCGALKRFYCEGPSAAQAAGTGFMQIVASSGQHTCAAIDDGSVRCFGAGASGQLGDARRNQAHAAPVPTVGLPDVVHVAAGSEHACVLTAAGEVYCFGTGDARELGTGDADERWAGVRIALGARASALALGNDTSCALLTDATVRCWGHDNQGQNGDGLLNEPGQRVQPAAVAGLSDVVQLVGGREHFCALRDPAPLNDGVTELVCWGNNASGQLGAGAAVVRAVGPLAVLGEGGVGTLTDAMAIAAGDAHSCAVRADGSAVCWGAGGDGRLGNGDVLDSPHPVTVLQVGGRAPLGGLSLSAGAIEAGDRHSCAVTDTGTVLCWGFGDDGRLGDDAALSSSTPVAVAGLSDAVAVSCASGGHSCALRAGGAVACWGDNASGALGDGTRIARTAPVDVSFAGAADAAGDADLRSPVRQVATGAGQTLAIHDDGSLNSWGDGDRGRRGTGSNVDDSLPRAAATAL